MKPNLSNNLNKNLPEAAFSAETLLESAREAVREAIARHKAKGDSIVVWRDGRVVILQPEEIEL